jgi:hypothetical protein
MLPIPFDSIPNALGITIHDFEPKDRGLVIVLYLAQHEFYIICHRPVTQVQIDDRNYVATNRISENQRAFRFVVRGLSLFVDYNLFPSSFWAAHRWVSNILIGTSANRARPGAGVACGLV